MSLVTIVFIILLLILNACLIGLIIYFWKNLSVIKAENKTLKDNQWEIKQEFEKNKLIEIERIKQTWDAQKQNEIANIVAQTRQDTSNRSRAALKGRIGEQMAPLMTEFYSKYELSDARFIGEPIDYIIFKNLSKYKSERENKIPPDQRSQIEIIIADVKTGKAYLSQEQRRIRDAILCKRVNWDIIRLTIPDD